MLRLKSKSQVKLQKRKFCFLLLIFLQANRKRVWQFAEENQKSEIIKYQQRNEICRKIMKMNRHLIGIGRRKMKCLKEFFLAMIKCKSKSNMIIGVGGGVERWKKHVDKVKIKLNEIQLNMHLLQYNIFYIRRHKPKS